MIFDVWYFIILAPAILLGIYAQWKVSSAYRHASRIATQSGITGAEAAAAVLQTAGVRGVGIEGVPGQLTDHYDPTAKVLRLSPDVYEGNSIASVGIAAHEAGHAIQDARRYTPLVVRNAAVPLANFGSGAGWIILVLWLRTPDDRADLDRDRGLLDDGRFPARQPAGGVRRQPASEAGAGRTRGSSPRRSCRRCDGC